MDCKHAFIAFLLVAAMLFSGCVAQGQANKTGTSKISCSFDSATGKQANCTCIVNPDKDRLAIIMKKGGALDSDQIRQRISLFLGSVEKDVGIKSIGISYFEGSSIPELDSFIEGLYYENDVGYVIFVGDEVDLLKRERSPLEALDTDLALVGKEWSLPKDEKGISGINPDAYCREVAVSWILPPFSYSNEEKVAFISRLLDRYTGYHNNENNILGQYSDDYLHVQWENNHTNLGMDLSMSKIGYDKSKVLVWNHDYARIMDEMKKKHYLLYYNVHGSPELIGLGLNGSDSNSEFSAVYTNFDEFSGFAKEYGTPSLLVQPASCGSMVSQLVNDGKKRYCCWPQLMLDSGVWAYYSIGSGQNSAYDLERKFSEGPFLGYALRNNPVDQYIFFGDITAHFR